MTPEPTLGSQPLSMAPSVHPTGSFPTQSSLEPSSKVEPTKQPISSPSNLPSESPVQKTSTSPTPPPVRLTSAPSIKPNVLPSMTPLLIPSKSPSVRPIFTESREPSVSPNVATSSRPTLSPTAGASIEPSPFRSKPPTTTPSLQSSTKPSVSPSNEPIALTTAPALELSSRPTMAPTSSLSQEPSLPKPTASTSLPPLGSNNTKSLLDVVNQRNDLNLFQAAAKASGLATTFANSKPLTMFAPKDSGFDQAYVSILLTEVYSLHLSTFIGYHATGNNPALYLGNLESVSTITTLQGGPITVTTSGKNVTLKSFSKSVSKIVVPNLNATNGVLHVVDRMLSPLFTTLNPVSFMALVDESTPTYTQFRRLLDAAGFTSTLSSLTDITLAAPSNAALSNSTVAFLLLAENQDLLHSLVKYHVLSEVLNPQSITEGSSTLVNTLEGSTVEVSRVGNQIRFNRITARRQDIFARGMINTIHLLLFPPAFPIGVPS